MKYNSVTIMLLVVVLLHLGLSVESALAYYSSSALSQNNTFVASIPISSPPSATPTAGEANNLHIVINEVQPLGTSSTEWVELYNPTNQSVDISEWKIKDNTSDEDAFPAGSAIAPQGYAVIITSASVVVIPNGIVSIRLAGPEIGSGLNNAGGDLVQLKNNNNTIVDQMNYGNVSNAFVSPPAIPSSNKTLSRIPNGIDTDVSADWVTNSNPTIGVAN